MLRGKMYFLVLVIVLVGLCLPMVVLSQDGAFQEGDQKVKLTKICSALTPTGAPGEFSGLYNIEWGVFRYDGKYWLPVDSANVKNTFFTLQVKHKNSFDWVDLKTDAQEFTYDSSAPESFVDPVQFKVVGRVQDGQNNSYIYSDPASPTIVCVDDSPGTVSGKQLSRQDVFLWFCFPWAGDAFERIPADFEILDKGVYGAGLQAKKAIDNSGVLGQFSASAIGVLTNFGFVFFFWGLFTAFYKFLFPVDLIGGWRFIFAGLPLFKYFIPFCKDPKPGEEGWVGFSKEYQDFLNQWRWVIKEINFRIKGELLKSETASLDMIYLKVYKTEMPFISDTLDGKESEPLSGQGLLTSLSKSFGKLGNKGKPTVRIIDAGLKNMVNNGITWGQASEEVDRAMEARAQQEITGLRRKSVMEYLINVAALTPLLGLLGTVTGISAAFLRLGQNSAGEGGMDPSKVIASLAPNINEALWTTVLGLVASIFLMLGFFFLDFLFDFIQARWDKLFVSMTEDM